MEILMADIKIADQDETDFDQSYSIEILIPTNQNETDFDQSYSMEILNQKPKYFKVTNQDEIHHDHKYCTGLNVLSGPFSETGTCVPGGLYYTDLEHLSEFFGFGVYLREVYLPEKDPGFKSVSDGSNK